MTVKNYDPKGIALVFAGIPITGYAKGTFVSIAYNEDAFVLSIGADGEGTRAKTNNKSATIEFTLTQSSPSNDLLSAIHNLDQMSPGGDGIGPFFLKDLFGTSLAIAETAWVRKMPDAGYGPETGERVWTLETDSLLENVGGNL